MVLSDGFEVSARSYYYLLDWNEKDEWNFIKKEFNKGSLKELTKTEYKRLFNKATLSELQSW